MSSFTATLPLDVAQSGRRAEADDRARRRAEDLLLVDGILRGEEDAFRRLVDKYQRPLYWVAYDVLHDADEARDAVQEAFIRVHGAIGRFDRRREHVFIAGMARSGSTALQNALHTSGAFAATTYQLMPFVLAPSLARMVGRLSAAPAGPVERRHGDSIPIGPAENVMSWAPAIGPVVLRKRWMISLLVILRSLLSTSCNVILPI